MNVRLKIINGRILTPQRIIPQGTIVVEGDQIVEVREGDVDGADALEIDALGKYVSPRVIDLHVHGGGGRGRTDGHADLVLRTHAIDTRDVSHRTVINTGICSN